MHLLVASLAVPSQHPVMKILVVLCVLVASSCLATGESTTTTTETATVESTVIAKSDDEEETMKTGEELEDEKSKRKRTIERTLGYGYNDIASARLLREPDGKYRYYQQTPQVRYYTSVRNSAPSEANNRIQQPQHQQQQQQQQQLPYTPSTPLPLVQQQVYNFQPNHIDTDSIYFTKPSFQQFPRFKGAPAATPEHNTPLFTGPPPHAPAFFAGQSLAHNPFAHNLQTSFLPAANFHPNPLLFQHPGAGSLALLQAPGHFGPQIIPVIILRVNDASANQHLGGISPAYLHGLQSVLYQAQQPVFNDVQGQHPVPQQLIYQQEAPATHNQPLQQKVTYTIPQKKPITPHTATPSSVQKLRKNIVLLNEEPTSQSESNYNQYSKVSFKEKA